MQQLRLFAMLRIVRWPRRKLLAILTVTRYLDMAACTRAHTGTYRAFAYVIIRLESIELQFARLEASRAALISLCTCRVRRSYLRVDRSPRIISRRRFCDRNYEVRHLPRTLPATVFRSNFDVYTFDTSQIHITYRLRAIFIHVQFFSLAAHNVILTAIFCEL